MNSYTKFETVELLSRKWQQNQTTKSFSHCLNHFVMKLFIKHFQEEQLLCHLQSINAKLQKQYLSTSAYHGTGRFYHA